MANQRQIFFDELALDRWRKILPGVPDDQIVLPRYNARNYGFPLPPFFSNNPDKWEGLVGTAKLFATMCGMNHGKPFNEKSIEVATGSFAIKNLKLAMKWWRSLRKKTVLNVQQQLYSRKNRWKDISDIYEFLACHLITLTWLNLPVEKQSAREIEKAVVSLQSVKTDLG